MKYIKKEKLNKAAYQFTLSMKLTLRMWKVNLIVFISFFFAMAVITCCTALIDNWICTQKSYYAQQNLADISICSFNGAPLQPTQAKILQKSMSVKAIAVKAQPEQLETPEAGTVDVSAIYGNIFDVFKVELSEGRFFTPEELNAAPSICVIGEISAKACGLSVGDIITLRGTQCEIIGLASLDANKLDVLVPMGTYFANRRNIEQQQTVYCITDSYLQASDYEISFLKADVRAVINYLTTAQELQDGLQNYVSESIKVYSAAAAAAFLFSVLNIYLIIRGKFDTKKYLYAIQRALGAKNGQIFFQLLSENIVMSLLASGAAIIMLPTALKFLEFGSFYYRLLHVIIAALLIALATGIVASILLFYRIVRLPIVNILQKEASKA